MQRELISKALNKRFLELGVRFSLLSPETFGDMILFASQLRERIAYASPAELKQRPLTSKHQDSWLESDSDCLASLRHLSLGKQLKIRSGQTPPLASFIQDLDAAKSEPERRIQLLIERYSCPLNFAFPLEAEAREHLLTRLMVHDRTRIEQNSIDAIDSDDLLLRLNLIAVHAAIVLDLRFLDALNYYYELLPATWRPHAQHNWLLVTYFALYARALAAWI